jgi:hypothetical protein
MEQNSHQYEDIYSQIEQEYGTVTYTYTTQIVHAGRLQKRSHYIELAQIVFSAISTSGFIGTLALDNVIFIWITGLFSIGLLIISAYSKDAHLSELQKEHKDTSDKLLDIRAHYLSVLTDSCSMSLEDFKRARDELHKKTMEIYKSAPITDSKSYSMAQKLLKDKEYQFFSREELDKMLPEHLRKIK